MPASGSSGSSAIGADVPVAAGHRQSVSDRQEVFLQLPEVSPLGILHIKPLGQSVF